MDPDKLSVVIKSEGSWSRKLFQKLSSPLPLDRLEVSIEGPYGPASTHFTGCVIIYVYTYNQPTVQENFKNFVVKIHNLINMKLFCRHDMLVMISGGSGITPFISIIRELLSLANNSTGKTPRILLISAFKKSQDLAMLDLILPVLGTTLDISPLEVQIEAYVTREKKSAENNRQLVQTLWFKPKAEDSPVSAILGPKSWLWLAAIISSSFIIFLVLIGFLTRYYIYPIDHNSNTIYATSWRGGLNMLLICVSIVITATAAFLWNKKQHTKEMTRIQNTEKPTPIASPASWFYNAERELESLPHQSFVQATRVHYGERPNLKSKLSFLSSILLNHIKLVCFLNKGDWEILLGRDTNGN